MMEHLSAGARRLLAGCQSLAMRGELGSALERLTQAADSARRDRRTIDAAALSMKKAELLHLDCKDDAARAIFAAEVDPCVDRLPAAVRAVVDQNRNTVGMALWDPDAVGEFYRLVDFRRQLRSEAEGGSSLAFAEGASAEGRYRESMPVFWREVRLTYESGSWDEQRRAQSRLGREWLKAGSPQHAAYLAMVAQDTKLMCAAADQLLGSRDAAWVELTLGKVLRSAHLLVHAGLAFCLISKVWDVIPEAGFSAVFECVALRAAAVPASWEAAQRVQEAWVALGRLTRRFVVAQVDRVVEMALGHPFLAEPGFPRKALIGVLIRCVPNVSRPLLERVSEEATRLVLDRRHDIDFDKALDLVRAIAGVSDQDLRSRFAERLGFKPPAAVPQGLSTLAPLFGFRPAELSGICADCARQVRLQVQRLLPGQTPDKTLTSAGEMTTEKDGRELHVFLQGGSPLLEVVLANREWVAPEALGCVVDAILESAAEGDNVPANRTVLLEAIGFLADRLDESAASRAFGALLPLAGNSVAEQGAPDRPFSSGWQSPFQVDLGDLASVRGMALYALAKVGRAMGGTADAQVTPRIESALGSLSPAVRVGALAAAGEMPKLSESLEIGVLMATRDGDSGVARGAFRALAGRPGLELSEPQRRALTFAVRMALQSTDIALRFDAARVAASLFQNLELGKHTPEMEEIEGLIRHDVSHSVRTQWT